MSETLNKDFAEVTKSDSPSDDRKSDSANSNGFVSLDVANLSLLATSGEVDFTAGHRTPVKKTLSRKGSQGGGKRKEAESAATVAAGAEKLASFVHVAGDAEEVPVRLAPTTTAGVVVGAGRAVSGALSLGVQRGGSIPGEFWFSSLLCQAWEH